MVASSSLVPANDPTLLFTNAGMVQFKDVFPRCRKTRQQPCSNLAESVCVPVANTMTWTRWVIPPGITPFSKCWVISALVITFKKDAILYAWQLLTEDYGLEKDRLWVTVYETDEEALKSG